MPLKSFGNPSNPAWSQPPDSFAAAAVAHVASGLKCGALFEFYFGTVSHGSKKINKYQKLHKNFGPKIS